MQLFRILDFAYVFGQVTCQRVTLLEQKANGRRAWYAACYDQVVDVISFCAMLHLLLIYIARQFAALGPRKLQLMTPLMHTKKHRSASLRKHKY